MEFRDAAAADEHFLGEMLYEAAQWRPGAERPSLQDALASSGLRPYLEDWPRPGDAGVVATEGGRPVGAAWFRLFRPADPGHGFVAAEVPELTIAVVSDRRGRGIGTALLTKLIDRAGAAGVDALSLSVDPDNRARALYERLGFEKVGTRGTSWTMLLELS